MLYILPLPKIANNLTDEIPSFWIFITSNGFPHAFHKMFTSIKFNEVILQNKKKRGLVVIFFQNNCKCCRFDIAFK